MGIDKNTREWAKVNPLLFVAFFLLGLWAYFQEYILQRPFWAILAFFYMGFCLLCVLASLRAKYLVKEHDDANGNEKEQ